MNTRMIAIRSPSRIRCGGFSIVSAIFLLVVLAGLGAAMLNIATVHHASSALDVQGARAYQAARTGLEWGVYQRLVNNTCTNSTSFPLSQGTTLSTFTVTVQCTGAGPWRITATACNQPAAGGACPNPNAGSDYVQRQMQVDLQADL
jgi:MSHA biogenesis protein MshP